MGQSFNIILKLYWIAPNQNQQPAIAPSLSQNKAIAPSTPHNKAIAPNQSQQSLSQLFCEIFKLQKEMVLKKLRQ